MQTETYPQLVINLAHLKSNINVVRDKCLKSGVEMWGVIKGITADLQVAKTYFECGVTTLASSRLSQLRDIKTNIPGVKTALIRVPALSEIKGLVESADMSLESELEIITAIDRECGRENKRHGILLMADMGDLREGFWDKNEMTEAAVFIERNLKNIDLLGIGTNLGCYGSIVPTAGKLQELADVAEKIEQAIGRRLKYISGGATSTLMRVWDGDLPERINHLRLGEGILNARDLAEFYGYDMSMLYGDVLTLRAEVMEVKRKPSHPVGEISVDAFGHRNTYVDRGIRKRALISIGKADLGSPEDIFPREAGVSVLGGSSDHTILDVEDAGREIKVGDILEFGVCYASMLYLSQSRDVSKKYIKD